MARAAWVAISLVAALVAAPRMIAVGQTAIEAYLYGQQQAPSPYSCSVIVPAIPGPVPDSAMKIPACNFVTLADLQTITADKVYTGVQNFTGVTSFAEAHGQSYTPVLGSNNYTLQPSDCGKLLLMPAGMPNPTITLFNFTPTVFAQGCEIGIDQTGVNPYTVIPATGGPPPNSVHGFTKTGGPHAVISLIVEVPSPTATIWTLTGDGA